MTLDHDPTPDGPGPAPLLVAGTDTLLLRLDHPDADQCRRALTRFAQLERAPGLIDTYRLTDLGLWNAKVAGTEADEVLATLAHQTGRPLPRATADLIVDTMARYGPVRLESPSEGDDLVLVTDDDELLQTLLDDDEISGLVTQTSPTTATVATTDRGRLKLALTRLRHPADDRAALSPGEPLLFDLRPETELRSYQRDAVEAWIGAGTGVVVLPCGAGKTVTALAAAARVSTRTLILTTGAASMTQWERELLRFTTIEESSIGRFGGGKRRIAPITLATYQMLATRRQGRYQNLDLVEQHDWGLIIYDEVHLLPTAVFGLTASIQARRRLGLTATLVREDGREADVFTLIGPKRYDVPWVDLELQGWIAPARCVEIRVVASDAERMAHARAEGPARAQIAAGTGAKVDLVGALLGRHRGEPTIVIGSYLDGLREVAERHELPLVTGQTPEAARQDLFDRFRRGELTTLALSKVGNYSLDLPEASVAIQISGTFGSRQEEAQRLGRLLRPKSDGRQATFYTLVTRDTVEQEHSGRRHRFLTEQGYHYEIVDAEDLA